MAFSFGGWNFAFKKLALGLSRSARAFSFCVSMHLQSCVAGDTRFVYFDDLGSVARDKNKLINNLEQIFRFIQSLVFKFLKQICQFGIPKKWYLGHDISAAGIVPTKRKVENFLANVRMTKIMKQVRQLIWFVQYIQNFIPNPAPKLHPFFKLLRKKTDFNITNNHQESLATLKVTHLKLVQCRSNWLYQVARS